MSFNRRILLKCKNFSRFSSNKCYLQHANESEVSSEAIRKRFIDYFMKENSHNFVRSSPVVTFCDPTVPFINAGMNQFKGVFLGQNTVQFPRVVNSQKCVRVGGKHNDLDIVGTDGYHHTFFEMLGNWSFGDYFKKDACQMAWNLLTNCYGLHPDRLYVTYFEGNKKLNLKPDLECREIWRQIGVPDSRILPFGCADNFWEMGLTGPCGPCTEIHVDHLGPSSRPDRALRVNGGYSDLTELWNIVFIQYNRNLEGEILPLPQNYIDTGMGLERLVAILQNKTSNYDTDLFVPIMDAIHKGSKGSLPAYKGTFGPDPAAPLDTAYRILADHARMVTVCLADGMFPDQNYKLRRILRKALLISEKYFNCDNGMLSDLSSTVAECLGNTYPELHTNLKKVQHIIAHEEEVLKALRLGATSDWKEIVNEKPELQTLDIVELPGIVAGYKELMKVSDKTLSGEIAYKLYDTHGLDEETISKLAAIERKSFDSKLFQLQLQEHRLRSKQTHFEAAQNDQLNSIIDGLMKNNVHTTDDSYKYIYSYKDGKYDFPDLTAEVQAVVVNGHLVTELTDRLECAFIVDRSCFYSEAGGQIGDVGVIKINNNWTFKVKQVVNMKRYLVHIGVIFQEDNNVNTEINVKVGDKVVMVVDDEHRINNMLNHTGTHLLNAAVALVMGDCATSQRSSRVYPEGLSLELAIYGSKMGLQQIQAAENTVRQVIRSCVPVNTTVVDSQGLLRAGSVRLVPGEVYPEKGIRLVEVINGDFKSLEACCGTHVTNTSHLVDFCLTGCRNVARGCSLFHAVTGIDALEAHERGNNLTEEVHKLETVYENNKDRIELTAVQLNKLRTSITNTTENIPHSIKLSCLERIDEILQIIHDKNKIYLQEFADLEMRGIVAATLKKQNFVVHFLTSSSIMESVPLQKVTRLCPHNPVLVIAYTAGVMKARCCVPQECITEEFTAQKWIQIVANTFKSQAVPPKGQNPKQVCNLKAKKIPVTVWEDKLVSAVSKATNYAREHLK